MWKVVFLFLNKLGNTIKSKWADDRIYSRVLCLWEQQHRIIKRLHFLTHCFTTRLWYYAIQENKRMELSSNVHKDRRLKKPRGKQKSLSGKRIVRWVSTVPTHHKKNIFKKTYAELSPEFEVKQMVVGKGDINDEVHLLVQKTMKQLE